MIMLIAMTVAILAQEAGDPTGIVALLGPIIATGLLNPFVVSLITRADARGLVKIGASVVLAGIAGGIHAASLDWGAAELSAEWIGSAVVGVFAVFGVAQLTYWRANEYFTDSTGQGLNDHRRLLPAKGVG